MAQKAKVSGKQQTKTRLSDNQGVKKPIPGGKTRKKNTLQGSDAQYRSFFENTNIGLYRTTPAGRIVMANPAIVRMLGYDSFEDLTGLNLEKNGFIPEFPREKFIRRLEEKGEVMDYETALKKKDGTPLFVRESARIIRNKQRKPIYYEGTIVDITKRKLVEKKLENQTEKLRKSNTELERLYQASSSLLSGTVMELGDMARNIIEIAGREFGQSNSCLFFVQEDSKDVLCLAAAGPYAHRVMEKTMRWDGPELVAETIRTGETFNVDDFKKTQEHVSTWKEARSELSIPLKVGKKVIGVIDVHSMKPGAFSQDDERLMSTFSERAALALENCRLQSQMERRLRQLAGLRSIDLSICRGADIPMTLSLVLDQVMGLLGFDAADILMLDAGDRELNLVGERGFAHPASQPPLYSPGGDLAWQVVQERRGVYVPNLQAYSSIIQKAREDEDEKFSTYLGIPLIAKGRVRGVLEVFHRTPLILGKDMQGFLEMLADQAAIAIENTELFDHLQKTNAELGLAYDNTLEGWVAALELRDKETEGHTRRVINRVLQLARALKVNESEMSHLYRGALLHDIGKMGVPDSIVLKPGPLTDQEWEIMRMHPVYAHNMLSSIEYLRHSLDIPFRHHEKWDGSGYPGGLKGEQIPLFARIFSVVDVWDALTSNRVYRKAWRELDAIQYIRDQSGRHFDPVVVKAFLEIMGQA